MSDMDYEGAFSDVMDPPQHLIHKHVPDSPNPVDVILCPVLEVRGQDLVIEYEILAEDIDEVLAERLILDRLLTDFCDRYYEDEANQVQLTNLKTGASKTLPYG